MRDLAGKTAFITGGASGIGFAMAQAFLDAGMKVAIGDIEQGALEKAVTRLSASGEVLGVACDVASAQSMEDAAARTTAAFGNVHVLCNNAGVAGGGGVDAISVEDWRWVMDVNVMGVIHGLSAFLPAMRAHGEGGHIVNTASMAGLQSGLGFSAYSASKFAVVNISEGLVAQLAPDGIGVSVLCPGFVRTLIGQSGRNRQASYGANLPPAPGSKDAELRAHIANALENGMSPEKVAALVLAAIRDDAFYIITHPEMRDEVDDRWASILAALDRAQARPS